MIDKTLTIAYTDGPDWNHLPEARRNTVQAAIEASLLAYAPYSGFKVGAALLTDNDQIISGNNQENAAYPLCNCAEQVVIQKAFSERPDLKPLFFAVYVETTNGLGAVAPCGACRQVLCESVIRSGQAFPIIMVSQDNSYRLFQNVLSLLPFHFDGSFLK